MALSLDLGLIEYFSIIFPALLIWVVAYMILEKTKILGENKSMHAIAALILAFIVIASRSVAAIINFISPWFVLMFIFLLLLLMVYRFMGVSEDTISKFVSTDAPVIWFIFAISIIIVVSGIAHVYGQGLLAKTSDQDISTQTSIEELEQDGGSKVGTSSFSTNISETFFHPKILGLLLIFLIAVFTISLLTKVK